MEIQKALHREKYCMAHGLNSTGVREPHENFSGLK